MGTRISTRLWEDRWRIAAWILPALMILAVARLSLLPLAERLRDARAQVALLRENRYVPAWLDSTKAALSGDVEALSAFKKARENSLNRDSNVQATVDRIRGLAQGAGMEVVKTTPVLAKADSLDLLKVRIEGNARYESLSRFFTLIKASHPDLFPEEMVVRQGGEHSPGRLDASLTVYVYDRRKARRL
ncbi:MAG: hypothetical protein JF616_06750 [Fibrobacteres bacterium]|jgi:hypothetical protein|nr:hypothetical protein [Fibrobacterota bacterium]